MTASYSMMGRLAALVVAILAFFALPSTTRAQVDCRCDHTTIASDADVTCKVTICYQVSQFSRPICVTIEPGSSAQIPCPIYQASIVTCNGNYVITGPAVSRCTPSLSVPGVCCIRACHGLDADGCPLVTISPAACLSRPCP